MSSSSAPLAASAYHLLADVGGTNTRVALAADGRLRTDTIRRYRNAGYEGLESVLAEYITACCTDAPVDAACIAVAGPVREDVASMTNIGWTIDARVIGKAIGSDDICVINDLQAQGFALPHLPAETTRPLLTPPPAPESASGRAVGLVVGIGTGFNAVPIHWRPGGVPPLVPPAEYGQTALPVRNANDLRLAEFVEARLGRTPCLEDIISGGGLGRIHAWLAEEAQSHESRDAKAVVAALATPGTDPLSETAAQIFVRVLGGAVGDLALAHLPFGGIRLIGGMARAIAPWLMPFGFATAFHDKGRVADLMESFAVTVIEDDYAALVGCASYLTARRE